jgi:hypothetical protein
VDTALSFFLAAKGVGATAVEFEFTCTTCGKVHRGMPAIGADAPLSYYAVPVHERAQRCTLGTDDCVIDATLFFVRGCVELPVHGQTQPFSWGVWVSISDVSYGVWKDSFHAKKRSHLGPLFGWLNSRLTPYPDTANLKTRVHLRDDGIRPSIELEPTEHPLAVEQRDGISTVRVAELFSKMMHRDA